MVDSDYRVFVVDDDATARLLLETALSAHYQVETFNSGEACLARAAQTPPDLCLLDVGLPGMDGYELCRRLEAAAGNESVPVVFVSGHDALEDILAGYEAGGEDYIVKPFDVVGLMHKIENLRRISRERGALVEQAKASDDLATIVMANLDEYAVLIKFLRTLNECRDYREVVDAVLGVLSAFHLEGAVQVRMRGIEKTVSKSGENWPLEIAVINHVRSLERVFEFGKRAAYNFERATILVTNMPVQDSDLCGRIRDNLAIVAESADAKLAALQTSSDKVMMRGELHSVMQAIEETIGRYGKRYDEARYAGAEFTARFLDDLLASFAHLGMTSQQEEAILDMVRERANALIDLYDIAGETQTTFAELGKRLEDILSATESD